MQPSTRVLAVTVATAAQSATSVHHTPSALRASTETASWVASKRCSLGTRQQHVCVVCLYGDSVSHYAACPCRCFMNIALPAVYPLLLICFMSFVVFTVDLNVTYYVIIYFAYLYFYMYK